MSIQLLKADEEKLPEIALLAHKIWQVHYPPLVGQAQVDYMLEKFYEPEALKKQLQEGQDFYLIHNDNNTIGFIAISQKNKTSFFIHKFYIDSVLQGKGIGETVFKIVKTMFKSNQPVSIQLTVNRQNFKSINFYFKVGFKIKEVADFDIGNGYFMNDFVMEWKGVL